MDRPNQEQSPSISGNNRQDDFPIITTISQRPLSYSYIMMDHIMPDHIPNRLTHFQSRPGPVILREGDIPNRLMRMEFPTNSFSIGAYGTPIAEEQFPSFFQNIRIDRGDDIVNHVDIAHVLNESFHDSSPQIVEYVEDIDLFPATDNEEETDLCSICMEPNIGRIRTLNCGHIFHDSCATELLRHFNTCPCCRARIL